MRARVETTSVGSHRRAPVSDAPSVGAFQLGVKLPGLDIYEYSLNDSHRTLPARANVPRRVLLVTFSEVPAWVTKRTCRLAGPVPGGKQRCGAHAD